MPLWRIYHATGAITPPDQEKLAQMITDLYSTPPATLPAFYVDVIYVEVPTDKLFVAGKPRNDFVRFSIEHLATHLDKEPPRLVRFHKAIDNALIPFLKERQLEWEYSVVKLPTFSWGALDGLQPSETGGHRCYSVSVHIRQFLPEEQLISAPVIHRRS
jgi:phenylpyruvate tautomerase PptA (4-oxalocrotonate tautomerase family)